MEAKSATPALRILARAQWVNSVGDGAFYVASVLYFTLIVGLSPGKVGLGLSIAWGLGFLLSTPIGAVADQIGLRRSAILLAATVALSLALLTGVDSWPGYVAVVSLYAVAQSGLAAVRQALLVVTVEPERRVAARARLQVVLNAGLGIGAGLGAAALYLGTSTAFTVLLWADAVGFAAAAVLLSRLPDADSGPSIRPIPKASARNVMRDLRYLTATGLNAVLYLYMPLLSVLLPVWVADRTAAPNWIVGVIFVANTAGVIALQSRVAKRVRNLRTAARSIVTGVSLVAVACLILAASAVPSTPTTAAALLLGGAAMLVLGEVFLASGSWEIGFALADPDNPGQWQGMYASGIPVARAVGPTLLLGWVVAHAVVGWLALATMFLFAGIALAAVATRRPAPTSDRRRELTPC